MYTILPKNLIHLAKNSTTPLYVVGGSVRDFLAGLTPNTLQKDWDICSPMSAEEFCALAKKCGFTVCSVFKNTGTVKLKDACNQEYEFSCFRYDKYVRGLHTPAKITFTKDIKLDALRRDFTVNAVYYDIQNKTFVDPLDGICAIQQKRLTTVAPAKKVFSEDGLRLLRLARFHGTLGFSPDEECLFGAMQYAHLIQDISPERIYSELSAILVADEKYNVKQGHYLALSLLAQTRVLDYILPELTLGRAMQQRKDFHQYDVLEHSLRSVLYADKQVRLACLLHDVGKPFCFNRDGNFYAHAVEGSRIAVEVLHRWKAPKSVITETEQLIALHMQDLDLKTSINKLRRFLVAHYPLLPKLLLLKQADFSACMDEKSPAPTCVKWQNLLQKMKEEKTPFSLKELAVNGNDLLTLDIPKTHLSAILKQLLNHTAIQPKDNVKERLLRLALAFEKSLC